jgi:hypothetical protein
MVVVNMPGAATRVHFDAPKVVVPPLSGDARQTAIVHAVPDVLMVSGMDGPTTQAALSVRLDPGESVRRTLRFTLPADATAMTVVPSARWPSVEWVAHEGGDARRFRLTFGS